MPIVNLQDLSEAREDIKTIEQVVNGPSGEKVRTRLGREISTLATLDERYDTFATETAQAIEDIRDDITLIGQNTDQAQQRADEAYDLADQIQSINKGGTGGETAAEARSNLEVYSKDEITTRLNSKLNKADNLSDLEDAEEARENLNVYDRAEVDALIASGGEGKILSIQNGGTGGTTVEEARTNLDVLSKTETNTVITNSTKQATESVKGQAKIATTAIAQAGTNNTDIITAKKLRDALNASGSAPAFAVRAWLNFNGTGTVTVRDGGNIASVIDDGAGIYTINFITPMPNNNYAITQMGSTYAGGGNASGMYLTERTTSSSVMTRTASSFQISAINAQNSYSDVLSGSLMVVC